nr:hypothetical protein [Herbaspirillum sp. ASV7]
MSLFDPQQELRDGGGDADEAGATARYWRYPWLSVLRSLFILAICSSYLFLLELLAVNFYPFEYKG